MRKGRKEREGTATCLRVVHRKASPVCSLGQNLAGGDNLDERKVSRRFASDLGTLELTSLVDNVDMMRQTMELAGDGNRVRGVADGGKLQVNDR